MVFKAGDRVKWNAEYIAYTRRAHWGKTFGDGWRGVAEMWEARGTILEMVPPRDNDKPGAAARCRIEWDGDRNDSPGIPVSKLMHEDEERDETRRVREQSR